MSLDPHITDLLASVALNTATPGERQLVESRASGDPEIAVELHQTQNAVAWLAGSADQVRPPSRLREAVLATTRPAGSQAREARVAREPRWRWSIIGLPVMVGTLAVIVATLLTWNVALLQSPRDESPTTAQAVAGTSAAPAARGDVVYLSDRQVAIVELRELPPLRAGQGYEIWRVRDGRADSAGFLEDLGNNRARGIAADLSGVDELVVTVEPLDNRAAPTTTPILRTAVPVSA